MKVSCPGCGFEGNISDKLIPAEGKNVTCPKCKKQFYVEKNIEEETIPIEDKAKNTAFVPERFDKIEKGSHKSYINTNLLPGEKIIYRTNLHWIIFFWAAFFGLLSFLRFINGFPFQSEDDKYLLYAAIIFFVPALILGTNAYISYVSSEFGLTNKRVIAKFGFIRRKSIELILSKIESLSVHQNFLGRFLGYGTIVVRGTGGTSDPFPKIKDPLEFRKKVQEQIMGLEK